MHATDGADKIYAYTVIETNWQTHHAQLADVRRTVFIEEQQVPETLEWDEQDATAIHLLALSLDGTAIGCARLLPEGRIGRMAVLPEWRGHGVGQTLLDMAIALSQEQCFEHISLSAQTHAIGFYQRAGFRPRGEIYDDAGIPHQDMVLTLRFAAPGVFL
jgi:predicted GNAT family N-acyltransferase